MKSMFSLTAGRTLIPLVLWLICRTTCSGADTNESRPLSPGQPDLGCDVVDGVTNKILRVSSVNPVSVYVLYEGGNRGRWILRQDLPSQLKAKYSYDPTKIAEYRKQQAELAVHVAVAQRAAQREELDHREKEILAEIATLQKQDVADQKEKNILLDLPPGGGRRVRAAHIDNDQQNIRERIQQLKTLLQQVRVQRDTIP